MLFSSLNADDALFDKYTGPLAECLADLGVSIQMAMAGEPGDVPSEAHARVQSFIEDLEEDCRTLPLFRVCSSALKLPFSPKFLY